MLLRIRGRLSRLEQILPGVMRIQFSIHSVLHLQQKVTFRLQLADLFLERGIVSRCCA